MGPICLNIILCLKGCSDSNIQVTCQKLKYILPMKLLVAASWLVVSVNFIFLLEESGLWYFHLCCWIDFSFVLWCFSCFLLVVFVLFGCFFFFSFRNTITRKSPRTVLLMTLAFWIEDVVLSSMRTALSTVMLHLCYLSNSACFIKWDVSSWANVSSYLRHPAGKMLIPTQWIIPLLW